MINIINDIQSFFEKHYQVAEFGFGNTADISNIDRTFPLVWLQPTNSNIVEHQINFNFDLFAFTLFEQDKENNEDSLNDMQQILLDFISYFKKYPNDEYWLDLTNLTLTPYEAKFDDYCNGWNLKINFIKSYDYQTCYIPVEPITPTPTVLDPITLYISQTSSSAYTYYNILVRASGGTGVYVSGTGTTIKQTGTTSYTVIDNSGNTATQSYTVSAPIVSNDYYSYYACPKETGSTAPNVFYPGLYIDAMPVGSLYYINWGDGTDSLIPRIGSAAWSFQMNDHQYATEGIKNIDIKLISASANTEIERTRLSLYGGVFNLKYFRTHIIPTYFYIDFTAEIYGDLKELRISKPTVRKTLYFMNYNLATSSIVGSLTDLLYWDIAILRIGSWHYLNGDLADLINQDYTNIYIYLQSSLVNTTISAINTGSTTPKSIKYFNLYSPQYDDTKTTNALLQVSQNQTYSGGTFIITGGTSGKINLSASTTLDAYNHLLNLGWSITIPKY